MPEEVDFRGAVHNFIRVIGKTGARSVEVGYFPLVGDEEPGPGEDARWWAKITYKGSVFTGEYIGQGEEAPLEALAIACRNAGIRVRLQYQ